MSSSTNSCNFWGSGYTKKEEQFATSLQPLRTIYHHVVCLYYVALLCIMDKDKIHLMYRNVITSLEQIHTFSGNISIIYLVYIWWNSIEKRFVVCESYTHVTSVLFELMILKNTFEDLLLSWYVYCWSFLCVSIPKSLQFQFVISNVVICFYEPLDVFMYLIKFYESYLVSFLDEMCIVTG